LIYILTSEASLGYLTHSGRPVLGKDGHPVRLCEGLWDRPTRDQLVKACARKRTGEQIGRRAPKGTRLLSGVAVCGNCGRNLHVGSRGNGLQYLCRGRFAGHPESVNCKPAPAMLLHVLDEQVTMWFLARYGVGQIMRQEFDPGTGYAARIAELQADRERLRADRAAGLYDEPDDEQWFRSEYARMGREIQELKTLPDRPAGMHWMPTGQTVAQAWHEAPDDAARRELLAEFDVRVTLWSRNAARRFEITGMSLPIVDEVEQAA
jgi:site-specific DNA recombinase